MRKWLLTASVSIAALAVTSGIAAADAFVDEAKAIVAAATSRVDKWDGPTTGPKAPRARPSSTLPATCATAASRVSPTAFRRRPR